MHAQTDPAYPHTSVQDDSTDKVRELDKRGSSSIVHSRTIADLYSRTIADLYSRTIADL